MSRGGERSPFEIVLNEVDMDFLAARNPLFGERPEENQFKVFENQSAYNLCPITLRPISLQTDIFDLYRTGTIKLKDDI